MTQTMIESLIGWAPVLLLIALWIYFMRKAGVFATKKNMEQQLAELKMQNEKLDRIVSLLSNPRDRQ
jgi:ATP-dependent Zn protease